MPKQEPPRRPPPRPDRAPALDQQPERAAVHHPGAEGVPPLPRKATAPGGFVVPRVSGEFAPTLPAPPPSSLLAGPARPKPPMPPRVDSPVPESDSEPPRHRGRQGSHPDLIDHRLLELERDRDKLEKALPRLEGKLGAVDGKVNGIELAVSSLAEKVEQGNASRSTELTKIIVAGVVTVVTAVIGAKVTTPAPEQPKTEIIKSDAEVQTEACKAMPDEQAKGICLAGVINRLTDPRKR